MDSGDLLPDKKLALAHAIGIRHDWARAIANAREMETIAKQPGRYEYDVRYGKECAGLREELAFVNDWLQDFEEQVVGMGRDIHEIFRANGGFPEACPPEGVHVQRWRNEGTSTIR